MGDFHNQWYSDVIVYDERKQYFYTWARKNKPHLDDEIRNESIANLDQVRRSIQHSFGRVGTAESAYSDPAMGATNAFKVLPATVANGGSGNQSRNFLVRGGAVDQTTESNIEHPAVLFARGFYIFLRGNIEYVAQNNLGNYLASNYTETLIPDLTDPAPGTERVDIVYVDLHFAEASAVTGTNASEYTDTNLKNPIVGTETASRARAVFDIRVWEDWRHKDVDGVARTAVEIGNLRIDENIFDSSDFLGALDTAMLSDPNPVNHHYRIPIAVIYRRGSEDITENDIVDLLDLYDKRILTQQEITHRTAHGGFTDRDVLETTLNSSESGYTGLFAPRWSYAKVDEGAYATGSNEGLGSEALNTNSVTPRTLDTYGQFVMDGLLVGGATGVPTGPLNSVTGPVDLSPGELVANNASVRSLYVNYDKGVSGNREYSDRVNIHMQGITGAAGLAVINDTGDTGAVSMRITGMEHFTHVDYQGRHGIDTDEPGWSGPPEIWNTVRYSGSSDAVIIIHDNAESAQVQKSLLVGQDFYLMRDAFGQTWRIPSVVDRDNPILFGITGIPQYGITGSPASMQIVPGIAVIGATGTIAGYTGPFGFYEAYDAEHDRVFTIGSRGVNFDRQVLSLYGTSPQDCFISDADFKDLPGSLVSTELTVGDEVSYDITLTDDSHITGSLTVTQGGEDGLQEVADDINYVGGMCVTGISYTFYQTKEWGDTGAPTTVTKTDGVAKGALVNYEGNQPVYHTSSSDDNYLHIVVKTIPEHNTIFGTNPGYAVNDVSMVVDRAGYSPEVIDFIQAGYFGSGLYGGDVIDLNFVKMDLGPAADAWLFNGDVFFNGDGLLNRVTFSPNVVFRDDVFIYGKLSAQELLLSTATITDLNVDRNAGIANYLSVMEGFALGYDPFVHYGYQALDTMFNDTSLEQYHLKGTVKGGIRVNNIFYVPGVEDDYADFGPTWALHSFGQQVDIRVAINGTWDDSDWPFGIHLIDRRQDANITKFSTFVIDGKDYHGDPPVPYNVKLWIKGDLEVGTLENEVLLGGNALIRRLTLGLNATEVDQAYTLSLKDGNAYISNLTVQTLQYDVDNPAGDATFYEPQNIKTIQPVLGEQNYPKNEGILRIKQFSLDTFTKPPAILRNWGKLGNETDYTSFASGDGLWAWDTCSFSREVIRGYSWERGDDTITSDQDFNVRAPLGGTDPTRGAGKTVQEWEYNRNNFSRIITMKLGTIKMVWNGFSASDATGGSGAAGVLTTTQLRNVVSTYQFSSTLFKNNEQGSNVFDWLNTPANVHMANIMGSFNDEGFASNLLYNIAGSLGIYYPLERWTGYEKTASDPAAPTDYFERFMYQRYNNRVQGYHSFSVTQQTQLSNWGASDRVIGSWEVAVYPKIVQQKMYGSATQGANTNSDERLYETLWDLNVVIYPIRTGGCNNLAGEIRISYM